MHAAARRYVADTIDGVRYPLVVEIGGRNINGGVRDLVGHDRWTSIDLEDGPDVEVVGDCRTWTPPYQGDLVLCLEVLEHSPDPRAIVKAACSFVAPGGRLLVTCAGPGREPHSGHDGMPWLQDGEHYANIDPRLLLGWFLEGALADVQVVYDAVDCDVRATGVLR